MTHICELKDKIYGISNVSKNLELAAISLTKMGGFRLTAN
jgi:hypothetical protein